MSSFVDRGHPTFTELAFYAVLTVDRGFQVVDASFAHLCPLISASPLYTGDAPCARDSGRLTTLLYRSVPLT